MKRANHNPTPLLPRAKTLDFDGFDRLPPSIKVLVWNAPISLHITGPLTPLEVLEAITEFTDICRRWPQDVRDTYGPDHPDAQRPYRVLPRALVKHGAPPCSSTRPRRSCRKSFRR